MASSASSYLSPHPRASRAPKLTYRTKSSDNGIIQTAGTDRIGHTDSEQSSTSSTSASCPSPRHAHADTYGKLEGRQASVTSSSTSHPTSDKNIKKKGGFFSGLFSVKEPSAQALLEYQKQLLSAQSSERRGHATAVGLPGVSSAQLPPTVPKVNSRWDGVPETAKEKDRKKQQAARQSMSFLSSNGRIDESSGSDSSRHASRPRRPISRATLGGMSTYSGGSSRNNLADLYGWEVTDYSSGRSSRDWAAEHARPSTSRSQSSKSAPTLQHTSTFPVDTPEPPKIPQTYLDSPTRPFNHSARLDHSRSPSVTPYNSSPVTPIIPSPLQTPVSSNSDDGTYDSMKTTIIEAPASVDNVIIRSAGVGILAPPASAKRRPNIGSSHHSMGEPQTSGTASGPSSLRKPPSVSQMNTPPQPPTPSSPSPGVLKRQNSARERLSLGVSLKHQAVAPWGWSELHPEAQPISGGSQGTVSPSPEEGASTRRRRLTLFGRSGEN